MTLQTSFAAIAGPLYQALVQAHSGIGSLINFLATEEVFKEVVRDIRLRQGAIHDVTAHVTKLVSEEINERYAHPHDVEIGILLLALLEVSPQRLGQLYPLIKRAKNTVWIRRVLQEAERREKTADIRSSAVQAVTLAFPENAVVLSEITLVIDNSLSGLIEPFVNSLHRPFNLRQRSSTNRLHLKATTVMSPKWNQANTRARSSELVFPRVVASDSATVRLNA